MAEPDPTRLLIGPGLIYVAPLGSTEPTDTTTALDAAWIPLGYTEAGTEMRAQVTTSDVLVAEELDPVKIATTGRASSVVFAMAEITAAHLKVAMNGGTIATVGASTYFDPPAPGAEVRQMILHQSTDGTVRWVFRQCLQVGQIQPIQSKAPAKALFACEFKCEKPPSVQPWRFIGLTASRA